MSTESDTVESGRVALPVENVLSTVGVWALFVTTILAGVALTDSVLAAGLEVRDSPSSFGTLGAFVAQAAAGTLVFLLVQRYDLGRQLLQLGFGALLAWLTGSFLSAWVGLSLPVGAGRPGPGATRRREPPYRRVRTPVRGPVRRVPLRTVLAGARCGRHLLEGS
jgi:hypothetical protein